MKILTNLHTCTYTPIVSNRSGVTGDLQNLLTMSKRNSGHLGRLCPLVLYETKECWASGEKSRGNSLQGLGAASVHARSCVCSSALASGTLWNRAQLRFLLLQERGNGHGSSLLGSMEVTGTKVWGEQDSYADPPRKLLSTVRAIPGGAARSVSGCRDQSVVSDAVLESTGSDTLLVKIQQLSKSHPPRALPCVGWEGAVSLEQAYGKRKPLISD